MTNKNQQGPRDEVYAGPPDDLPRSISGKQDDMEGATDEPIDS